ncbi:14130_t:CDS:1, partial [Funneliformis mosseae]
MSQDINLRKMLCPSTIPSGLVTVPVKVSIGKEDFKLNLSAGFLCARQDKIIDEYVISPAIGWRVTMLK